MNHPHEMLAAYVDGTASMPERADVEAHLTFCPACQEEIQLARSALVSLRALSEVEAPELDRTAFGLPGPAPSRAEEAAQAIWGNRELEPAGAERPRPGRFVEAPDVDFPSSSVTRPAPSAPRRSTPRWPVRTAQAALAAAAVLVAVVVVVNLGGRGNQATLGVPKAAGTAPSVESPKVARSAQSYSATTFSRLAEDLAQEVKDRAREFGPSSPAPGAGTSANSTGADSVVSQTSACVRQATSLSSSATLYYARGARYEGTKAYIGAFVSTSGQQRSLIVVAVSVDGCRTLRYIRLAL
jgi:anti-sigma factor RsiW